MNKSTSTKPFRRGLLALALVGLAFTFSCESEGDDATGGETHFLRRCQLNGQDCTGALSCICGVCTLPCEVDVNCGMLPSAECVTTSASACGSAADKQICTRSCDGDGDCRVLSAEHHCEAGTCVLGDVMASGGSGNTGSGGNPGSGGSEPGGAPSTCEVGQVNANEVLILGDSFLAVTHEVTAYLEGLARNDGALPIGQRYRDSSTLLNNSLAFGGEGIWGQFQTAFEEAPAKVVLLNGGGADLLRGDCETLNASCPLIVAARDALARLFIEMEARGVESTVFLGYPNPVPENVRVRMDVLRPELEAACQASPVPCVWVDLRPVFEGHPEYVGPDGLSPTSAGAEATAAAVWAEMKAACIAQ